MSDDVQAAADFLPVLVKQPRRMNSFRNEPDKICEGYGLSFFDTLKHAVRRFEALRKKTPNIHKALGDHVAQGTLDRNDGVMSCITENGHYTLHEFRDTVLNDKFLIVYQLR